MLQYIRVPKFEPLAFVPMGEECSKSNQVLSLRRFTVLLSTLIFVLASVSHRANKNPDVRKDGWTDGKPENITVSFALIKTAGDQKINIRNCCICV